MSPSNRIPSSLFLLSIPMIVAGCAIDTPDDPVVSVASALTEPTPTLGEPAHTRPVALPTGLGLIDLGVNWDGRLLVGAVLGTVAAPAPATVRMILPEAATDNAAGVPNLYHQAFSAPVTFTAAGSTTAAFTSTDVLSMAITPIPEYSPTPGITQNPFPADATGAYLVDGAYDCYEAYLYLGSQGQTLSRASVEILVANPRTATAKVVRATALTAEQPLLTTAGKPFANTFPTITFDGRLLLFGTLFAGAGSNEVAAFSYNADPTSLTGWAPPQPLANLYTVRDTVLAGLSIATRYPIAQQQLRAADGTPFAANEPFYCLYPWISFDGSELACETTKVVLPGNKFDGVQLASFAITGRATNWTVRVVDGPINPDRQTTERALISSPGMTNSFWTPYRNAGTVLPFTGARPTYLFFQSVPSAYNEVDMQDALDQDYVLIEHMNELVTPQGTIDSAHTPDTAGLPAPAVPATGALVGAEFAFEYNGVDKYTGLNGSCLYFHAQDYVRVPSVPALQSLTSAVTAQLAVKRLAVGGANLASLPGSWTISLDASGYLNVAITRADGNTLTSGPQGNPIPVVTDDGNAATWSNVAFSYDASSGVLDLYQAGIAIWQTQYSPVTLAASSADLIVGPAGVSPSSGAVIMLDELYVSRVARTAVEIARNAFVNLTPPALATPPALPVGLKPADAWIPVTAATSAAAVALGQQLFFDTRLSRNGSLACASCHQPGLELTDGLVLAKGMFGATLTRNSPSVFNRALSIAQFFDGRAATAEAQAAFPIDTADELDSSIAELAHFLASSKGTGGYAALFAAAFPDQPIGRTTITAALAAFERSLLVGGSRVDLFEAGDTTQLTTSEQNGRLLFRGKARCITCHTDSNYSDEQFHDTSNTTSSDAGRGAISGRTADAFTFKTPSLRLLQQSAPYLHDGSQAALTALIALYNGGGLAGVAVRDRDVHPLELTTSEQADLLAFLDALQAPTPSIAAPSLPPNPIGPGTATLANATFDSDLASWDSGDQPGASWLAADPSRPAPATGLALLTPVTASQGAFIEQAVYIAKQTTVSVRVAAVDALAPGVATPTVVLRVRDATGATHDVTASVRFASGWVTLSAPVTAYGHTTVTVHVEAQGFRAAVDSVSLQ